MKIGIRTVIISAIALLALYTWNFLFALQHYQSPNSGPFGDTFGAVNSLFSGAALFFLVLAFISQREELTLVRAERDDTRTLLKKQDELVAEQMEALTQQTFETSFLSKLELLLGEKRRLEKEVERGGGRFSLMSAAASSAREIIQQMENGSLGPDSSTWPAKTMDLHHARFFLRGFQTLGDLIVSSSVNREVKGRYSDLLIALADEKIALCFAALSLPDQKEMKRVEDYFKVFEMYDLSRFLSREDNESFRNARAVAEKLIE